ncbi:aldose epimerase family protein [Seonamhaeicola marinus]|uniref:Aldose 1-epimerase n=1 Tax=Seonamhaeicola marinus TaxID=1912246 RepID=A0A5D0IR58_9FLAO|nr:aldose epimerase family protein [Seonamhaeicola marinus]TYA84192.1 galactose mutarotase [Seonamhaeicola marinus]
MSTTKSNFGEFNNQNIELFTLSNDKGMTVKITNYGATITSLKVPVDDEIREVACGFDTLEGYFGEDYKNNSPYFGCTVGRYCSQIKDAKFSLNGEEYKLADNCGPNNLHGGAVGYDKKVWVAKEVDVNGAAAALEMTLASESLEEGFPGNVDVTVVFSITNDNELHINYNAKPDADTPLSLTNHTYFNLSGFSQSIENHTAQVNTNKRLETDDTGAATGVILDLEGKADDLRNPKRIADVHQAMGDGFEHFYVFDNATSDLIQTASITNPSKDLTLDVFTTEPCMLLYTGKYTSDDLKREDGTPFGKYRAFCCETHRYPNGPNIENSPGSITKAGDTFESTTIFKFK